MIRGLYADWFEGFVIWVPLPRLGPPVDRDGVTAYDCEANALPTLPSGLGLNRVRSFTISLTSVVKHEQHPFLLVLHFLSASIVVMPTHKSFLSDTIFQNCNFAFCCCLIAIFVLF